jgi:uncharacterized membrane protein
LLLFTLISLKYSAFVAVETVVVVMTDNNDKEAVADEKRMMDGWMDGWILT